MLVIQNTQFPESTMRKKSNYICYHEMRESVVMVESLMNHITKNANPSDLMTKVLAGQKGKNHFGNILYNIYDEHH